MKNFILFFSLLFILPTISLAQPASSESNKKGIVIVPKLKNPENTF